MSSEAPPPLRVLVCPQEFKGSLTAFEAAEALAAGVRRALSALPAAPGGIDVRVLPMADGGPGTAAIVGSAAGGKLIAGAPRGPLGDHVAAHYALVTQPAAVDGGASEGVPYAVVESAQASGLTLLPPERRDPLRASSYGTGEQVRDALRRGAKRVVVGVGGTATNDGGAGAAQALGLRLLDRNGRPLPPGPLHLAALHRIEGEGVAPALGRAEIVVATDVTNPLLGPSGATAVYGRQKGVRDWQAPALEAALATWAERCRADLGLEVAAIEGAGAGGGMPVGLLAAAHAAAGRASIGRGAALVGDAVGLRGAIEACDLVVTGEGRLDAQTAFGKAVAHVAALAANLGRPCLAVAGTVDGLPSGVRDAEALTGGEVGEPEAMARAAELVAAAAARLVARWVAGAGAREG